MALNQQTANFPPISLPEQSWSLNLRAVMTYLGAGAGAYSGMVLGVPLAAGVPTTGLVPTLSEGVAIFEDNVIGINPSAVSAAPPSITNRDIFFGLEGYYYADDLNTPRTLKDIRIGTISTSADSIIAIAQPQNYGGGRYGVKGYLRPDLLTDGADTTFFTWVKPAIYQHCRIAYAQSRVVSGVTAGGDAGDDLTLKVKKGADAAVTLTSLTAANLGAANTVNRFAAADGDAVSWHDASTLLFQYNQTDATTALAGGLVEVAAVIECF